MSNYEDTSKSTISDIGSRSGEVRPSYFTVTHSFRLRKKWTLRDIGGVVHWCYVKRRIVQYDNLTLTDIKFSLSSFSNNTNQTNPAGRINYITKFTGISSLHRSKSINRILAAFIRNVFWWGVAERNNTQQRKREKKQFSAVV